MDATFTPGGEPPVPVSAVNPFTIPQKPFQPTSTPENFNHRFMIWNNAGIIRSYSTEDEEFKDDAIDIEFHDITFHHDIHLRNQFHYNLGNMSTEVVALGCAQTADNNSKLMCLNFGSWDSSKEWTIDFPDGEEVTGIALGTGWVAAATTENRLRLFSVSGIQKFTYDLAGTIIALTGYENLLFIIYHNGVGINGNQNMYYAVLKLTSNCSRLTPLIIDSALPLSRGSTLSWMGFSDEGTPVFLDSKEILKILNGRLWSPFCNMKEHLSGASDHFWVVGVSETALNIRGVKCKGAQYPPTLPRPTIEMLEAKIPLCEMDTEKSQLEDVMLQQMLLSSTTKRMERKGFDLEESKDEAEGKTKETLFKLFAMSCTHNRDLRASEYVAMMPTAHAMQLAMEYSSKLHRVALIDRLQVIGHRKLNNEDKGNDEEFDDFESTQIITHIEHHHFASDGELRPRPNMISNFLNPFKNDNSSQGSKPTRTSSSTTFLNASSSCVEDSQHGLEVASNGMSKIDLKNPKEKQATLPDLKLKGPKKKSVTGGGKTKNVQKSSGFLTSNEDEDFHECIAKIEKPMQNYANEFPTEYAAFQDVIQSLHNVHESMKNIAGRINRYLLRCPNENLKEDFSDKVYRPKGLYQETVKAFTMESEQICTEFNTYPTEFRTRKDELFKFDVQQSLTRLLLKVKSTVKTLKWHLQSLPRPPVTPEATPPQSPVLSPPECFVNLTRLEDQDNTSALPTPILGVRTARVFKCKMCPKTYWNKNSYHSHLHSHRDRKFLCDTCGKKFVMRCDLTRHLRAVHKEPQVNTCLNG